MARPRPPREVEDYNAQFGTPDEQGNYSRVVPVTDPMQGYRDILGKQDPFSSAYLHAVTKLQEAGQLDQLPEGFETKNGRVQRDRPLIDPTLLAMMVAGGGLFGAPALIGALGAGSGASAPALSSLPVSSAISVPAAGSVPLGALGGGAAAAGGSALGGGAMSGIGFGAPSAPASAMSGVSMGGAAAPAAGAAGGAMNYLPWVKMGLDFLGGLGGDDSREQPTKPYFEGTGPTDPRNMLFNVLSQLYPLASAQQEQLRRGPQLRSDYGRGDRPLQPINIPGLPFQIGGGLGMDPAQRSQLPSLGLNIPEFTGGLTHPQLGGGSGSSGGSSQSGSPFKRVMQRRRKQ